MRRIPQPYRNGELVIVIDCSDLDRSARFWAGVLGYAAATAGSGRYQTLIPDSGNGIEVLLQRTPDAKHGKNRLHLDLRTADLAAEVSRIAGLGGRPAVAHPGRPGRQRVLRPAAPRPARRELSPRTRRRGQPASPARALGVT